MRHIYNHVDSVVKTVENVVSKTDRVIEPVRQSAFKRFPVLFTLLVAFGVAATSFGVERIIAETYWLNERPWLILCIGLGILVVTGKLYKKLS